MKEFILKHFSEFDPKHKTVLPALILLMISFIWIIIHIISGFNFYIPHLVRVLIVINAIYVWILIFIAYYINYQKRRNEK